MTFINDKSVLYIEAQGSYTFIYYTNGRREIKSKSIKYIIKAKEQVNFIRCHAKYAVNSLFITNVVSSICGTFCLLIDGTKIPISRRKLRLTKTSIYQYKVSDHSCLGNSNEYKRSFRFLPKPEMICVHTQDLSHLKD